ncbi:MAG TPA: SufS family cysteine desulfurase [Patescibacteria group bacterium]|jgi:cysteine desulfurase/selenocysteine lyase
MADFTKVRTDFPALTDDSAYLDSAATAQKPETVLKAMDGFYRERYAPVSRGKYAATEAATAEYRAAREAVASFIGASDASEIVFTQNATASIDLVARCWAMANLGKGDSILLTEMEHHSNFVPWRLLAEARGLELRLAKIDGHGTLDINDFKRKLPGAKLVAVTHASNVLGTINPVTKLAALAHEAGAKLLVDGAQAVPGLPVDVGKLGADWYAFSGHKAYGPTGIGVLWTRREVYREMTPAFGGGGTVGKVTSKSTTFLDPPAKFEAGTPPVAEAIGLAAALEYLEKIGMGNVRSHAESITTRALETLQGIDGVTVLGPPDAKDRVGLVTFLLDGVHPGDLAVSLDHDGVAIRSEQQCTQPLHQALGLEASARASFGIYTDESDIDRLHRSLLSAKKTLV